MWQVPGYALLQIAYQLPSLTYYAVQIPAEPLDYYFFVFFSLLFLYIIVLRGNAIILK